MFAYGLPIVPQGLAAFDSILEINGEKVSSIAELPLCEAAIGYLRRPHGYKNNKQISGNQDLGPISICVFYHIPKVCNGLDSDRFCAPEYIIEKSISIIFCFFCFS